MPPGSHGYGPRRALVFPGSVIRTQVGFDDKEDTTVRTFRSRWNEPGIVSYAQNAEDVRLWRIFGRKPTGYYVDVGAGDPTLHSVTKLFYDAGWSGLNIEPGPLHADLVDARPRDVNLRVAVAAREGEVDFWISSPDSGLSGFNRPPDELVPEGFSFEHTRIRCARLDTLIEAHASGREIDFLKIDVEGAERDVLGSVDLDAIRPTVVLVEAISPLENRQNHEDWEPLLVDRGYLFAAFDGINRLYVPVERAELIEPLAYPMSVLDRYEPADAVGRRFRRQQALERQADLLARENAGHVERIRQLEAEKARLAGAVNVDALARLDELQRTTSWRVTRPLRAVRRAQLRLSSGDRVRGGRQAARKGADRAPNRRVFEQAFAKRIAQAATVLDTAADVAPAPTLDEALEALERALSIATVPDRAKAWAALVAVDGSLPGERSVERVARRLRMEGANAVRSELLLRFDDALRDGSATTAHLDVRRDAVVVDVTHTVSHSLHTGIQRVVRETVSRWLEAGLPIDLVQFDLSSGSLRPLAQSEYQRLKEWRTHVVDSGAAPAWRTPERASEDVLVPWSCRLVIPELAGETRRCSAYRALRSSSVIRSLSLVGFDLIPIVASETVADGMTASFGQYLSMVKHAHRISAISRASADGFRAFGRMAMSEGLQEPLVAKHALPTEAPALDPGAMAEARRALGIGSQPLVLVVGSHEPRKNHLVVLEAAERLWASGQMFQLLFIGGSGWKTEEFDEFVARLMSLGRPIAVRKRSTEEELWAAYGSARFSVFPSLVEGFGLPVAESLAVGTPAVTSAHGSMAEIAEGGGCLVVDPRDVDAVETAMSRLLRDDRLLERLQTEASSRPARTWDDYAGELWSFLVGSGLP